MRMSIVIVVLLCFSGGRSHAWSTKEHILLTRMAVQRLISDPATPPAMTKWLFAASDIALDVEGQKQYLMKKHTGPFPRGADGLAFWATVPDQLAMQDSGPEPKKIAPFGAPERMLHFIDLENFFPIDEQRSYADDLSHKPSVKDIPRDMSDPRWQRAGMLPFRVEQCYAEMISSIRAGRLIDKPGQLPRDDHAQRWAGMLAHYVEDNTQPQHATADYKSQSYFADRLRAPNVHVDMESRLTDDEFDDYPALRLELWNELQKALSATQDPSHAADPWMQTVEISLDSYDALPLIGHAAVAAYHRQGAGWKFNADTFFHYHGQVHGKEMTVLQLKAQQMALGIIRVEHLWLAAWQEAQRPAPQPTTRPTTIPTTGAG